MAKAKSSKNASVRQSTASGKVPQLEIDLPVLPSLLTQPLGLEGWERHEPLLLAALASEEPLLLIGPHGSAKSFLLERLAKALELDFRFYNASLLNYDDLVGFPMPDDERRSLRYITTPSAIWGAEVVFFDEINRTRTDLQNKLFPIIHERRVQGILLEKLRFRWAAMNPSAAGEDPSLGEEIYIGADQIDPALADRFAFLIEVPGWRELGDEERRRILRDQYRGEHDFPVRPAELVDRTRELYLKLQSAPPRNLEDYLLAVIPRLEQTGMYFSTRRATAMHRNILAVHAARTVLYTQAYPSIPAAAVDWRRSALTALGGSFPQVAVGKKPDPLVLLAAHRQAWEIAGLDADNPWRDLLSIADPFDRCLKAISVQEKLDDDTLSEIVLNGLGSISKPPLQRAAALVFYVALHSTRNLRATVWETIGILIRPILDAGKRDRTQSGGKAASAKDIIGDLLEERSPRLRERYAVLLLQGLLSVDGFENDKPADVVDAFSEMWNAAMPGKDDAGAEVVS